MSTNTRRTIREEVAKWQHLFNQDYCFTEWEDLTDLDRAMFMVLADALLCRLSPLGVVIKVYGDDFSSICGYCEHLESCQETHPECDGFKLEASFTAFESLTGE